MNSTPSSVMLDETPCMFRLAPFVTLVFAVLVAPLAFAQPAKPAAKPVTKAATTPATKPGTKTATKGTRKPPKNAPVLLVHINRHEEMPLRLRDAQGRPVKGLQRRFDRFLRCHHTNKQHAINPRLMRLLYQTGKHWPGKRVEVVSGYRHPKVAKNPRSPHMQGQACDFRVEGVKAAELRDYLRSAFEKVGVGYYPNSSFVHLDVRKDRSAFWIDYSGPGERAVYSANPNDDLRSGRADKYHPTKIDSSWANEGELGAVPTGTAAGSEAAGQGAGEDPSGGSAQAPSAAAPQADP